MPSNYFPCFGIQRMPPARKVWVEFSGPNDNTAFCPNVNSLLKSLFEQPPLKLGQKLGGRARYAFPLRVFACRSRLDAPA